MASHVDPSDLGKPTLKIEGFQLWIHGREFPDAHDVHDGNWLRVTAHCGARGASVWAEGAILQTLDIKWFAEQCGNLLSGSGTEASLGSVEPYLNLKLTAIGRAGHIAMVVEITPDFGTQAHSFQFEIDQSYLPSVLRECEMALQSYPVRSL